MQYGKLKKQEKKKKKTKGKTKDWKRLQRKKGGKIVNREHFPVSGWARLTVSTNSQGHVYASCIVPIKEI